MAVPGKFHRSGGHNKSTCLQDRSNFHGSRAWQIVKISNTAFPLLPHMMTSSNGNIFALLAICAGNSPVLGEFPSQRPVTRSFDVIFGLRLNERLSKNNRKAGDLRRHRAHYDVINPVPVLIWLTTIKMFRKPRFLIQPLEQDCRKHNLWIRIYRVMWMF